MDEYSHLDEFFNTLNSKEVWSKIVSDIKALRTEMEDGGWLNGKSFDAADLQERMEFDLYRTFSQGDIARIFQERLLKSFSFPPITANELATIAAEQFAGASLREEFVTSIQRFNACVGKTTYYTSEDINLADSGVEISSLWFESGDSLESLHDYEPIWRSQHGFWLTLTPDTFPLTATVWGKLSDGALEAVLKVMCRLLPSASTSLHLVFSNPLEPAESGFVPFEVDHERVTKDLVAGEKGFFSSNLCHYFHPPAKKTSSIEQRLRNAVHLLVEADNQSNESISLSLSCAAIEALVCEKTEGIVDELTRHVAALLQPNAMDRPAAMQAVKDLYKIRSKALHGDLLEHDDAAKWKARLLASAVLKGVVEWCDHIRMVGAEPSRDEFLRELRNNAATGQQMVGVSADLSRLLPR